MVSVLTPQSVLAAPAPIAIEDGLRKWRIERTIDDPFEFGRIYFPKYWFQKSPDFHQEIMNLAMHRDTEEWKNKRLNTLDRKSTRLNSSHVSESRMPSSA